MRTVYSVTLMLTLILTGCLLTGCAAEGLHGAKPVTRIGFSPASRSVEFYDSKDNDVTIKNLAFTAPGGSTCVVEEVTLRNNSSDVRAANYLQMQGYALQAQANWQGAAMVVDSAGNALGQFIPFLGGGGGGAPSQAGMAKQIMDALVPELRGFIMNEIRRQVPLLPLPSNTSGEAATPQ